MPITLDLTMNLVNRTAVFDIGHELSKLMPSGCSVRYWRFFPNREIRFDTGKKISTVGKAIGRLAWRDYGHLAVHWSWPRYQNHKMLFLDPLFCASTRVSSRDIVVCHDLGPVTNPEFYNEAARSAYDNAYRAIQRASPRLVFVSEFTKHRFETLYGRDYRASDVIPLYAKSGLADIRAASDKKRERPFFLMVGTLERRKNFVRAVAAFAESGLAQAGYDLVIVGPRGNDAVNVLPQIEKSRSVEYLGFVSNSELKQLYETAEAFFFPSLLEGFGVPALEAGFLGVLPIVSAGTVLEEVVGPGGIAVDPRSIASMADGLKQVASMDRASKARRQALVASHQAGFTKEAFRRKWSVLLASEAAERLMLSSPA
ncbi:glycosyltransferase family 4 protein [Sinorhizobium fredii]|uniref:glycosyltransferase family 4 protein n=1 Tax=Rhizobium fredii TaxID=380 RepID=UPI001295BD96|nr:glycosyltransferase family 1 protein [Sinorhizobium fredii]MQW96237.1 glycosyltransferase [Sinorhizobium fredii]UTY46267.1 glycosyltransferase family 1 protein [Sinorhizobium fredii]